MSRPPLTARRLRAGALTLGLAAALVLAPAAVAGAASADTAALQIALRARGFYAGDVDGIAGRGTRIGLRRFQRRAGLTADGVAGPATRRALGRRGRPRWGSRALRQGRSGWDVGVLQFKLAMRGFPSGALDGGFGARTTAAVRRFQRHAGLAADGIVGRGTMAALRRSAPRLPFRLTMPVPGGHLTDGFRARGNRFHVGVDIPASSGATVHAAAAGRVATVSYQAGGWGTYVVVDHGSGVRTLYAHLSAVLVRRGQAVARGATIGRVGASGAATGPHLHLEALVRGANVDPARALG